MKALIPSYLKLPVILFLVGTLTPLFWIVLSPDTLVDFVSLLGWVSNFWYVAISLAATEAVVRAIFVRPQEYHYLDLKNHHLQFIVRNVMLGLILLVCNWNVELNGINEAAGYLTMRLGTTLLLLGALVLTVAHNKMKSI